MKDLVLIESQKIKVTPRASSQEKVKKAIKKERKSKSINPLS